MSMQIQNQIIDGHCHLADPRYSEEILTEMMDRSINSGITGWVQGGVSPKDWNRQREIQQKYGPGVITAFGLHPWWISERTEEEIECGVQQLRQWAPQAQAIGETGLDRLHRFLAPEIQERQERVFKIHLEISQKLKKPLILHIVRAHSQAIRILKQLATFPIRGVIHSFSGSEKEAMEYIKMGFYISFSGSFTRGGHDRLKKTIPCIPLEKIMVETDSPDQTPQLSGFEDYESQELLQGLSERPQRLAQGLPQGLNEPRNLIGISKALSELLKMDYRDLLAVSTQNIRDLFRIE